ncbi:MAG: hypothetical protein ACJAYB_000008 [Psychromonas sp.]|jgi:hypothetical protein
MPDSLSLTSSDLYLRLQANLPAGYTDQRVKYPNAPFTATVNEKWIWPVIIIRTKDNVEAGGEYTRTYGDFAISINYPKGQFDQLQLQDAELLKTAFQNQSFGNTRCQESQIDIVGEFESWYTVRIIVKFYFEGI